MDKQTQQNNQSSSGIPDLSPLMDQTFSTEESNISTSTGQDGSTPHSRPTSRKSVLVLLLLLLSLSFVGIIGYQLQTGNQIADIRNRAQVYPPTSTPSNQSCSGHQQSCGGNVGCCSGLVCQGVEGSQLCQVQNPESVDCPGGGTCTGTIAFHCSGWFASECHDNPSYNPSNPSAHVNGCGQVDQVCQGGSRHNQLCGAFTISKSSCGVGPTSPPNNTPTTAATPTRGVTPTIGVTPTTSPSNTPQPSNTPPPTSTPVIGQCQNLKIYKEGVVVNPNSLLAGDTITIAVVGTNATKARVQINNENTWRETTQKNNNNEYILNYSIPTDGTRNFQIKAELLITNVWR